LTLNLFTPNHNFAGSGFTALLGLVVSSTGDLNTPHVHGGGRRRGRLLSQCSKGAQSKWDEKCVSGVLEVHGKKFTEVSMPLPCKVQVLFLTQVS
jgi:hypothetical protein